MEEVIKDFDELPIKKRIDIILNKRGKEREKLIIQSRDAKRIVQSLPEEEIFFTIKEIGEKDAVSIISLTSPRQMQYLLDIELWKRNQLDIKEGLNWLSIIAECGWDKIKEWIRTVDPDLIVTLLKKYIKVYKIDIDKYIEEIDKFPSFTLDNIYFIEFKDIDSESILSNILRVINEEYRGLYITLMEAIRWEIDAEIEEEALRWRNTRLSEKGFPELDEALNVYRYINLDIEKFSTKRYEEVGIIRIPPQYPLLFQESSAFIYNTLTNITDNSVIGRLKSELAYLSNKVLIADCLDISNIENIEKTVKKVSNYLNIGLEYMSNKDIKNSIEILTNRWMEHIFQIGYSLILKLKLRAKRELNERWGENIDIGINLLDSPVEEIIRGIIKKRPLFFSNDYREFKSIDDIMIVKDYIKKMEYIERLFIDILAFPIENFSSLRTSEDVKWSSILITLFANLILKDKYTFGSITLDELKTLLIKVFEKKKGELLKRVKDDVKKDFIQYLINKHQKINKDERIFLEDFVNNSFEIFEEEFGLIDPYKKIDSRFVKGILIKG